MAATLCILLKFSFTKVYFFVCFIPMASYILCCSLPFSLNIFYISFILFNLTLNLWGHKAVFNLFSRPVPSTALQSLEPFLSDHSIHLFAPRHSEDFGSVCPPFQANVCKIKYTGLLRKPIILKCSY